MLTTEQIRAARALLRIEQTDLATRSGVSLATIKRLETRPGPIAAHAPTVDAIRRALEEAGVIFVDQNGDGPGVRLKRLPPALSPIALGLLEELSEGPQTISGNRRHDDARMLVDMGYAESRSLNLSSTEYNITSAGVAALRRASQRR
jgi:transcriptional regulator with XRE-family HTH domain